MGRSFWAYVKQNLSDLINTGVEDYAQEYIKSKKWGRCHANNIDDVELCDTNIKSVRVENDEGWKIRFDIIVEATFLIHGHSHSDGEEEDFSEWFLLCCGGNLAEELQDAHVISIEAYNAKRAFQSPMTDKLIPFIKNEEYDNKARGILKKYYPEALQSPVRINPEVFAERIGLKVLSRAITEDKSVFGQIFFQNCNAELYDREKGCYYREPIRAKTILIDKDATFLYSFGTMNATVIHECVHYLLHHKAFLFAKLFDSSLSQFRCKIFGGQAETIIDSKTTDDMEYQANTLAPRILMPSKQFTEKAQELIEKYKSAKNKPETIDVLEPVIEDLAQFFGVSKLSAKIRMIELGFEEATGTFIFLDGRYIMPHKYNKGAINKNQTFSVGIKDALIQILCNPDLYNKVVRGEYLYVDSHFVLNSDLYVDIEKQGISLTDYARYHMDECCLHFDIALMKSGVSNSRYSTICILNREIKTPYEYEIKFHDGYENSTPEKRRDRLKKSLMEDEQLYQKMPNDYLKCLQIAKKERNVTYADIAESIEKDEKTVRRIFSGESNSTIETLVAICLAMHLPPKVSYHIVEHSPLSFKQTNDDHLLLQFALNALHKSPMQQIRKQMKDFGVSL